MQLKLIFVGFSSRLVACVSLCVRLLSFKLLVFMFMFLLVPLLTLLKLIYLAFWEILNACIDATCGMSIADFWHVDSWGMVIFGRSIAVLRQVDSWNMLEMVVEFTRAHLSQLKFVPATGVYDPPTSVEGLEHWTSVRIYVRVICATTDFRADAGRIDRDTIVTFFSSKNFNILSVKRSENRTAICLVRLSVYYSGCNVSTGVCPDWMPLF